MRRAGWEIASTISGCPGACEPPPARLRPAAGTGLLPSKGQGPPGEAARRALALPWPCRQGPAPHAAGAALG